MPVPPSFDYAVVRVVPRVDREEFLNVGVVVFSAAQRQLTCRVELDAKRLRAFAPACDVDGIAQQLEAFRRVCQGDPDGGPVARLPPSERFHWLVAPRSTMVQTSTVHAGVGEDAAAISSRLFDTLVASG